MTLILRDGDQNTGMNNATSNDVLSSYDILAVQPESERALHAACTSIDIDIICIDFSIRMPFPLKAGLLRQALARGIAFEITYAPIVSDAASRKAIIGNVSALLRFGFSSRDSRIIRGGLLVSSDADMPWKLRPPQDVCNLLGIMGVPAHARKTCLTDAAEKIILHAASRKYTFRGVVIPPPVLDRRSEDSDLLEDFIELK